MCVHPWPRPDGTPLVLHLSEGLGCTAFLDGIAQLYEKHANCDNQTCARPDPTPALPLPHNTPNLPSLRLAAWHVATEAPRTNTHQATWELPQRA
jgi:hypothetical protein